MLLELTDVGKTYSNRRAVPALQRVNLSINQERPPIVAVVGESGSGKSTLGGLILGFIEPSEGTIRYHGQNVHRLDRAARKQFRREVQAIPQDPFASYNPFYPVEHALLVPIRNFGLARTRSRSRDLIEQACASVGLNPSETLGRYPHQLSGGQRQRLMVARALLLQPRLLVADEPVSMVDASLRATILGNVAELNQKHGIAILYITHDLTTAYHIADRVLVLYRGQVVEDGSAQAVVETPKHPYTQLLIDSIPSPDLTQGWGSIPLGRPTAPAAGPEAGCSFRNRCPATMGVCATVPELREAAPLHAVSCHLYTERAPFCGRKQASLLREAAPPPPTAQ